MPYDKKWAFIQVVIKASAGELGAFFGNNVAEKLQGRF